VEHRSRIGTTVSLEEIRGEALGFRGKSNTAAEVLSGHLK
jgi:hypothetical protein